MSTHRAISWPAVLCLAVVACAERGGPPSSSPPSSPSSPPPPSPPPPRGARLYDPATVETIRGQVERVDSLASQGRMPEGLHVIMKLEGGEAMPVHLGPAWFVESQGLGLAQGDALEVTGSRVIFDGAPALIARTVAKGTHRLVLRDEAGVPAWSAGRRSAGAGAPAGGGPAGVVPPPGTGATLVLSDAEQQALRDALDDEYRAWATYDQIIRDLGAGRPFINIREAEMRHIEALRILFQRYELAMPENPWLGRVPRLASVREACQAGVDAEIANAALYDRLTRSTSRQDLLAVFGNLRSASQDRHLPAFRRCAAGGPRRGAGPG